jgi:hypothetical protein
LRTVTGIGIQPSAVALLMCAVVARPASAEAPRPPLPSGTKRADEGRWRSPLSFEATRAWYEKQGHFGGRRAIFHSLVDRPDVRAVHAPLPAVSPWSGLNVSVYDNAVWIFFIGRDSR